MVNKILSCFIILLLFNLESVEARGLRTHFSEVVIENLRIGHSYSVKGIANLPLCVTNTSNRSVILKIEALAPCKEELREGYEAIPDISWIGFEKDLFELEEGEEAVTDVIISIPDSEEYLGKRYQAWIWSHTIGPGMIGVGLKSRILFSIAKEKEEAIKKDLSILPTEIYTGEIKIGEVFDVKEKGDGIILRVSNLGEGEKTFMIEPIKVEDSPFELKEGYEDCPNPRFLILSERIFSLPKDGEKEIEMYIAFPKKEGYKGKRYEFIVHAKPLDKEKDGAYSRIYVSLK
ncbi:MAG: hypothetical protein QME40_07365 [bacterium]|nr:hypothetical protein [bacterium]